MLFGPVCLCLSSVWVPCKRLLFRRLRPDDGTVPLQAQRSGTEVQPVRGTGQLTLLTVSTPPLPRAADISTPSYGAASSHAF